MAIMAYEQAEMKQNMTGETTFPWLKGIARALLAGVSLVAAALPAAAHTTTHHASRALHHVAHHVMHHDAHAHMHVASLAHGTAYVEDAAYTPGSGAAHLRLSDATYHLHNHIRLA